MRTWLLSPDIKILRLFELDISQPLDHPKYHNRLLELFGKRPGFDYLHHQVPGSRSRKLFCEFKSMRLASQYFWTRQDSIVARTDAMYDRYKTLQEYMKKVRLWEKRAPAIGLVLFFSAVSLIPVVYQYD